MRLPFKSGCRLPWPWSWCVSVLHWREMVRRAGYWHSVDCGLESKQSGVHWGLHRSHTDFRGLFLYVVLNGRAYWDWHTLHWSKLVL